VYYYIIHSLVYKVGGVSLVLVLYYRRNGFRLPSKCPSKISIPRN